jgi:hypothetical protein
MKTLKKIVMGSAWLLAMNLSTAQADAYSWLNHFDLVSGNPRELVLSSNSTSSGVGGGLTGVVVKSTAVGSTFTDGGNKVVQMALDLPPQPAGITIRAVRVCYESANTASYISQIRIAEVQNPPSSAIVRMDDATPLNAVGPTCVNSKATSITVGSNPLLLSLRFSFNSTADAIVIRGLGVILG